MTNEDFQIVGTNNSRTSGDASIWWY